MPTKTPSSYLPSKEFSIMNRILILVLTVYFTSNSLFSQELKFEIEKKSEFYIPGLTLGEKEIICSPDKGLWSIATEWKDGHPEGWEHTSPVESEISGEWQILKGEIALKGGILKIRDAYRSENGMIKCIRRFHWTGKESIDSITLSVRWKVVGNGLQTFLPGIIYYGNPSGTKNTPNCVPSYTGKEGEVVLFEDHRYPMPFACLESAESKFGAAIHTIPSMIRDAKLFDHWWSMGVKANKGSSELLLLSGPITYNYHPSVAKALQCDFMKYDNTFIRMTPDMLIEKTFYLDLYNIPAKGTAFQKPVHDAINRYKPFFCEDLPEYDEILKSKYRLAKSRWVKGKNYAGFNMYDRPSNPHIVMGWCGQAGSPGFSLQMLKNRLKTDKETDIMIQESLDFLSSCPVSSEGFPVLFNVKENKWSNYDPVSMGQGMYNIAKAIETARKSKQYDTKKWEAFIMKACDVVAERILNEKWNPRSTAEGFYVAPLCIASKLFNSQKYRNAAIRAAEYYAKRHSNMEEPYWGGTLDASGEDKEGAWAAFQAFLNVYELTGDKRFLDFAKHACDVCLSYTVVWDIPLTPGRMSDHLFKTRGWTVVSPQNQHIDVYGVLYTPEIYRMGILLNDDKLKRLAKVMFRTCGQLIDPYGSQGEQLQQTNFAQAGDMSDIFRLRGGYVEHWTVFWITAHFLNAAARFEEMNVEL